MLFLCSCAILLNTDRDIRYCAIVAQLDRAFGSDPEGQRFESSRSHQEKPRHNVPGLFFFVRREDSNSTALRSRVSNQPSGLLLSARFPTGRNVYQQAALCPENRKKLLRVRPGGSEQQRRRPLPAAETGRSCWGSILIFQSPAKGLRKNQQMQLVRPHPKGGASDPFYPLRFFCQMRYRPSVIRVSR